MILLFNEKDFLSNYGAVGRADASSLAYDDGDTIIIR